MASGLLHLLRGGIDVPPPMWTEADLIALPDVTDNAWVTIGPSGSLPWIETKGKDLAPTGPYVAAELARPEVVELLQRAPTVLASSKYVDPNAWDLDKRDSLRLSLWHWWIAMDAAATAHEQPEGAGRRLASLFSLSVNCANEARTVNDYRLCIELARRDLELMRDLVESTEGDESHVADTLIAALRETPLLSDENAIKGQYVEVYGQMTSMIDDQEWMTRWGARLGTDLRATFTALDESFLGPSEDRCARFRALRERSTFRQAFGYNMYGNLLLWSVGTSDCYNYPSLRAQEQLVADQRQALLTDLEAD